MAKIFFPFADQPKQLPFLIDKTIRFPFTIDNLLYYCDISPGGITMYLHPETISIDSLAIQMVLMEIKDMLYLANGEIQPDGVPIVELSKKSYVTFHQYSKGLHTIGLLDPLSLGDLDPFSFANIIGESANWMALENCVLEAISKLIMETEHIGLQLSSNSIVETSKNVALMDMKSTMYSTGIGAQRIALLGEMDTLMLNELDGKLITLRVFSNLPITLTVVQE